MIDASHCKVHPHATGAKGDNQDMNRTKEGSRPRYALSWMQVQYAIQVLITQGTRADCKETIHLIDQISAETLLTNRGYDTNQIIVYAVGIGVNVIISTKQNRKQQRLYADYLYRFRHLMKNAFGT